jgi:heterodisulfide reductase subunit B
MSAAATLRVATTPGCTRELPEDGFYLTPSCILGAVNPGTETLLGRIFDLLGLRWKTGGGPDGQCSCCTGILAHGDVVTIESTLLVVARLWSVAAEQGLEHVATACVTSYGIHQECLELYREEPGLAERVDRWLQAACGRRLIFPRAVVHASDIVWRHRERLGAGPLRTRLVDARTGRPLHVVEHVGCHYNKLFPEQAIGGNECCDVLAGVVRAWGGEVVDYPERRHCCGMGFRQSMIQPNRGYSMACVQRKLESMAPFAPDLMVTNCPGCNQYLDREQWAINELTGSDYRIPVVSYSELTGLLAGWDPYDVVGVQGHTTPVEPFLDKVGIPYDRSRALLG